MNPTDKTLEREESYIIFALNGELYGTPLLSVREIVEPQTTKPVPYTPNYFLGLMNLRGQIISVIDLKVKFGMTSLPAKDGQAEATFTIILDFEDSVVGVLVNQVIGVRKLGKQMITFHPVTEAGINSAFMIGATRLNDTLVTLIDLKKLIDEEELERFRSAA